MAFFGIDSEVADYKKRQAKAVEQIAINKLDNLVKVSSSSLSNDGNGMFFTIELEGDFDNESFEGSLLFSNKANKDEAFSQQITRDFGSKYFAEVSESLFKNPEKEHEVKLVYTANPIFTDSIYNLLLDDLKDRKLVDEIIHSIENKGIDEKSIDLPNVVIPNAIVDLPAFKISPKQSVLNSIRGLGGKIDLFVAGVKMKNDYDLDIDANTKKKFGINIVKKKTGALITLSKLKNGIIRIKGTRKKDGRQSNTSVSIKIQEPVWKNSDEHLDEIYTGSPYNFNGLLQNLDRPEDYTKYKLKISGLIKATVNGFHSYKFSGIKNPGEVYIQLYIDGKKLDKMIHKINVVSPPCPEVSYQRIGSTNEMIITVEAFGLGNKIKRVRVVEGAETKSSEKAKRKEHSQGYTYERKIFLYDSGGDVLELKIFTNDSYCGGQTIKRKAIF